MDNKKQKFKLVMFDMDGTLLDGRSIFVFSEEKGFKSRLMKSLHSNKEPYEKSIEIATFLEGFDSRELLEIFRKIPLQENTQKTAKKLKEKNIKTAIVTDSYQFVADDLKERLNFDYAFANNLIIEQSIVTGKLVLNNVAMERCSKGIVYSICKGQVLETLCNELDITSDEVIAIGDGVVDIGMIKKAGLGIAYKTAEKVQKYADIVTNDLSIILNYI